MNFFYLAGIRRTIADVNDGTRMSLAGSGRPESEIKPKKRKKPQKEKNRISRVDWALGEAHTRVEESNWTVLAMS